MSKEPKIILLADDDLDDQQLLEEAFLLLEKDAAIHTVSSAKEVLEYLQTCPKEELPHLIVLDFNMPDFTGAEVLELIYAHTDYKKIPVVVWSTSNSPFHKSLCEEKGAVQYFSKPNSFIEISQLASKMLRFCNYDLYQ
jgi:CheY-like chemotaxis protein